MGNGASYNKQVISCQFTQLRQPWTPRHAKRTISQVSLELQLALANIPPESVCTFTRMPTHLYVLPCNHRDICCRYMSSTYGGQLTKGEHRDRSRVTASACVTEALLLDPMRTCYSFPDPNNKTAPILRELMVLSITQRVP